MKEFPVTVKDPFMVLLVLTLKPFTELIDAVAGPSAMCERFNPTIPLDGILYRPAPLPVNEPEIFW